MVCLMKVITCACLVLLFVVLSATSYVFWWIVIDFVDDIKKDLERRNRDKSRREKHEV